MSEQLQIFALVGILIAGAMALTYALFTAVVLPVLGWAAGSTFAL